MTKNSSYEPFIVIVENILDYPLTYGSSSRSKKTLILDHAQKTEAIIYWKEMDIEALQEQRNVFSLETLGLRQRYYEI